MVHSHEAITGQNEFTLSEKGHADYADYGAMLGGLSIFVCAFACGAKTNNAPESLKIGVVQMALSTRFDEPFTRQVGRYDLEVRYFDEKDSRPPFALIVNREPRGAAWGASGLGRGWITRQVPDVAVGTGDEIRADVLGAGAGCASLSSVPNGL